VRRWRSVGISSGFHSGAEGNVLAKVEEVTGEDCVLRSFVIV
jgi:hypothetical protein